MSDQAEKAGRGGLAVLGAKVYFIVTGLVQQVLLPRAISLADYGALSRVLAVSNVFNNVLISSSTQGVSRTVAAAGEDGGKAFRATLRIHAVIALIGAALLGIASPFVAHFQHSPDVLAPLLVMTAVLGVYGVYAPLIGYLNGKRMFVRQATLDVVAATLRTAGFLGLGYVFVKFFGGVASALNTSPGVLGATLGATLAAIGVFSLALRWTGVGKPGGTVVEGRAYVALIVPIMVAQLFTNGLMQADIFLVGRYASLAAEQIRGIDPAKDANEWVAVYRASQLFAFLPYQLLFSVTQILFPMLAAAKASEGPARVAELVRRGGRIGAIVCGMLLTVVVVMPWSLIDFAYGSEVADRGAFVLRILAMGQGAFAMLGLIMTILVSLGHERAAMALTAMALVLLTGACQLAIPGAPFGWHQLIAAAIAVWWALSVSLTIGVSVVRHYAGAFMPWKTALRVGVVVVGAWSAGFFMPHFGKLITPVVAGGVVLAYLAALVVTGELGKGDLGMVTSIAARRAKR